MPKPFNKKTIVLVFIALTIFSSIALKPLPAQADWLDIIQDVATEILKEIILPKLVDRTVEWIQGGGDPKLISDWPEFFRDAVDQASDQFIKQMDLSQLCSSFKLTLQTAFISIPTFGNYSRTSCTMSDIRVNLENFLDDFNSGGWIAWNQMVLNPQNNVYGAYLMAWDQQEIEKEAAANAAKSKAQAGKGFLGVEKCVGKNQSKYSACEYDCEQYQGMGSEEDLASCTKECEKTSCTKWETITPGSIVGDLAAKALGSDIDHITGSNSISSYIGAITNAIVNRVTKEGVGLLNSNPVTITQRPLIATEVCANFVENTEYYDKCLSQISGGAPGEAAIVSARNESLCASVLDVTEFSDPHLHGNPYDFCISTTIESQSQCASLLGTNRYDDCIVVNNQLHLFCTLKFRANTSDYDKNWREFCTNIPNQIQDQCSQFLDEKLYGACIIEKAEKTTGLHIREYQKTYMISLINQDLTYQNQLLKSKQDTLTALNQSINILNQLGNCLGTTTPALAQVQSAASTTTSQISQIQSDIINLQTKKGEWNIEAVTDPSQISSLWTEVLNVAKPTPIYNLLVPAQQETSKKQQEMNNYQQQLDFCKQQKP